MSVRRSGLFVILCSLLFLEWAWPQPSTAGLYLRSVGCLADTKGSIPEACGREAIAKGLKYFGQEHGSPVHNRVMARDWEELQKYISYSDGVVAKADGRYLGDFDYELKEDAIQADIREMVQQFVGDAGEVRFAIAFIVTSPSSVDAFSPQAAKSGGNYAEVLNHLRLNANGAIETRLDSYGIPFSEIPDRLRLDLVQLHGGNPNARDGLQSLKVVSDGDVAGLLDTATQEKVTHFLTGLIQIDRCSQKNGLVYLEATALGAFYVRTEQGGFARHAFTAPAYSSGENIEDALKKVLAFSAERIVNVEVVSLLARSRELRIRFCGLDYSQQREFRDHLGRRCGRLADYKRNEYILKEATVYSATELADKVYELAKGMGVPLDVPQSNLLVVGRCPAASPAQDIRPVAARLHDWTLIFQGFTADEMLDVAEHLQAFTGYDSCQPKATRIKYHEYLYRSSLDPAGLNSNLRKMLGKLNINGKIVMSEPGGTVELVKLSPVKVRGQ